MSQMNLGQRRKISGNFALDRGSFYGGDKTTVSVSRGRVNATSQLSARADLPAEVSSTCRKDRSRSHLVGSRVTYTMTPLMFASALLQYNSSSHAVGANVRLRWEYRPGSEFFVVYNEDRDTLAPAFSRPLRAARSSSRSTACFAL